MANDRPISTTINSSPRASEADQSSAHPKTKAEIDEMPGAGAPMENEAEGEGDGATGDEVEDGDGAGI